MKLSLSKKIILTVELVVILVAISSVSTALIVQKNTLEQLTNAQLQSVSVLKEYNIKRYINHVIEEINFTSETPRTRDTLVQFLQNKNKKNEVYTILQDMVSERDIYSDIFIMDREGLITASTNSSEEGKIRQAESFFLNAKEESAIQGFYYNVLTEKPELIATTPIKNKQGIFMGVLAAKIKIEDISNIMLEKSGLGETGETFIVNSSNQVVTSLLKEPGGILKKTVLYLPQVEDCLHGNSNSGLRTDYHSDEVYGYWRYLPEIRSCLVTKMDSSEVLEPLQKIVLTMLIVIGIIILLVGAFGYLVSQSIINPLLQLSVFASKIKGGDFGAQVNINSKDEIGDLAASFNVMTVKLQELYATLDQKVKEKTSELSNKVEEVEKSKMAILNLLEDIESEKSKVDILVKERTQELNLEKARLLASINSLSFGFVVADMNHHILLKNRAIVELLNFNEKDDLYIDNISERLNDHFDVKSQVEICLKDKNVCEIKEIGFGAKFFRGIIAPIIMQGTDDTIGYVFLLEDITEARAIDKAKSEFVSLASHQLRTPLSAINWYGEMLLEGDVGKLTPEQQKFMEEITISSKRMSSLVGTLLNVSRMEMGTFPVEPESLDLCKLIEEEVKELKFQLANKSIELESDCNLKPAITSVDPKIISIVMQNFLTNSIKYTPAGGKVVVGLDKNDDLGGIVLSVTDNGHGIPKEDQDKIFMKMYRSDNARALDADGNGLGLYMVKTILEASGCKISLESPPKGQKEGTAFYVHIPKEGMKQVKAKKRQGMPMS